MQKVYVNALQIPLCCLIRVALLQLNRRNLIAGGATLGMLGVGVQLSKALLARIRSPKEERQLAAVASRLGVNGVLQKVSPLMDPQTGRAAALLVVTSDGTVLYTVVDSQQPSRLLLKDRETERVFALQTRVDRVNINNQAAMEVLFSGDAWEKQLRQLPARR